MQNIRFDFVMMYLKMLRFPMVIFYADFEDHAIYFKNIMRDT